MSAGEGGARVGRKGFRRVRKWMGRGGSLHSFKGYTVRRTLVHGAQKTFSNMPFAFRKKTRIPLSLAVEHRLKLESIFIQEELKECYGHRLGCLAFLEQRHIFHDSDQLIKHRLSVGYKLRSLPVSKFNKVKRTRHSPRVVYTIPGANFCPLGDIWRRFWVVMTWKDPTGKRLKNFALS